MSKLKTPNKAKIYKCHCCGKLINSYLKSMTDYTWKKVNKTSTRYYCSYSCMRKEEKHKEEIVNKKIKADLINMHDGALSLKEAKFLEDMKIILNEQNDLNKVIDSIKTREQFETFIRGHYKVIREFLDF